MNDKITNGIADLIHHKIKVIGEAKRLIKRAIDQNGPFSHNMISLTLRSVDKDLGTKYANQLIRRFKLTEKYGIEPKDLDNKSEKE